MTKSKNCVKFYIGKTGKHLGDKLQEHPLDIERNNKEVSKVVVAFWLTVWLTDWWTGWLTNQLTDWLVIRLTDLSTDFWLCQWQTDCLIHVTYSQKSAQLINLHLYRFDPNGPLAFY